ncbi:hypothetical protein K7X08_023137 [Anisodus acutangulus]|uniref:Uncharacterized protein n=1 Tax=Anisodus acutangulus TaxID=402998 RepID=A0A9Q1LEA5_9SOLA|nr:hypothetical protein K7X08_023137 [Anisodus acutangulus]
MGTLAAQTLSSSSSCRKQQKLRRYHLFSVNARLLRALTLTSLIRHRQGSRNIPQLPISTKAALKRATICWLSGPTSSFLHRVRIEF